MWHNYLLFTIRNKYYRLRTLNLTVITKTKYNLQKTKTKNQQQSYYNSQNRTSRQSEKISLTHGILEATVKSVAHLL